MLKKLQIKLEFYEDVALGLMTSLFLIYNLAKIEKPPEISHVNAKIISSAVLFLVAIGTAYYSLNSYVKKRNLWSYGERYKNLDDCKKLLGKECQIGKINKFLEVKTKKPFYDVYFSYESLNDQGETIQEIGCITATMEDDPELLLSLNFTFAFKDTGIYVRCLDKEKYKRTHTRVPVDCQGDAELYANSINGYEFIYRVVKHEDELFL